MNTTVFEEAQNIKVRFHIGRGGRFHNAGHKTYVGTVNDLSDCFGESFIISEDENGKTVVRTMEAREIIAANRLRRTKGEDARIAEYARLFNEKYSEPQEIRHVELNNSERRFFELHHMRSIGILTPDEEDEYQRLLDE